jgi:hypothetical protein
MDVVRRLRGVVVPAASGGVGAACAAAVIAFAPGVVGISPAPAAVALPVRSTLTEQTNRQRLTASDEQTMLQWARRYRACAAEDGLRLTRPRVRDNEVVLRASDGSTVRFAAFMRTSHCTDRIGPPSRHWSFVLDRHGKIVVYRPRACLLPVKEAGT